MLRTWRSHWRPNRFMWTLPPTRRWFAVSPSRFRTMAERERKFNYGQCGQYLRTRIRRRSFGEAARSRKDVGGGAADVLPRSREQNAAGSLAGAVGIGGSE